MDIEGSFKAGREGAKPGTLVLAAPQVGNAYRQEFALGDAEDVAEVISITGTESVPAASCSNNCLVTRDFTPLEPGVNENKYYAPGVGTILEVDADDSWHKDCYSSLGQLPGILGLHVSRLLQAV